eukprot:Amastigsp_a1051_12.p5 type:complete len:126 gc:universal Amastigsp_a1051_12:2347-2724(+)
MGSRNCTMYVVGASTATRSRGNTLSSKRVHGPSDARRACTSSSSRVSTAPVCSTSLVGCRAWFVMSSSESIPKTARVMSQSRSGAGDGLARATTSSTSSSAPAQATKEPRSTSMSARVRAREDRE